MGAEEDAGVETGAGGMVGVRADVLRTLWRESTSSWKGSTPVEFMLLWSGLLLWNTRLGDRKIR